MQKSLPFQKTSNIGLQGMFNYLVESFSTLFTHVNSSFVISNLIGYLAHPIAELLSDASKKTAKVYNNAFQQKVRIALNCQSECACLLKQ